MRRVSLQLLVQEKALDVGSPDIGEISGSGAGDMSEETPEASFVSNIGPMGAARDLAAYEESVQGGQGVSRGLKVPCSGISFRKFGNNHLFMGTGSILRLEWQRVDSNHRPWAYECSSSK